VEQLLKTIQHRNDTGDREQRCQAGAIVGNSGPVQPAIRIDGNFLNVAWRKHRIEMRRECDVGTFAVLDRMRDNIAAAVDTRHCAECAELCQHPFGALLFEKGGRGNPAELELLLSDLLFIARKTLQRLANSGSVGNFGHQARERNIARGGRGFERCCQMSV
jgi:hypothetical protein